MRKPGPDLGRVASLLTESYVAGHAGAAYALGTWYLHGRHFRRNLSKAIWFLRRAAGKGNASAQFDLAVSFETGVGVPVNLHRAAVLYIEAALSGETQAFYEVGRCYYYGIGVSRDRDIARVWLDKAHTLSNDRRK